MTKQHGPGFFGLIECPQGLRVGGAQAGGIPAPPKMAWVAPPPMFEFGYELVGCALRCQQTALHAVNADDEHAAICGGSRPS